MVSHIRCPMRPSCNWTSALSEHGNKGNTKDCPVFLAFDNKLEPALPVQFHILTFFPFPFLLVHLGESHRAPFSFPCIVTDLDCVHQGQRQGKKLAAKRTKALVAATNFNETEIGALNVYFQEIGEKKKNEVVIGRDQFKSALGLKESLFINRMFLMFDTGKN